MPSSSTTRASCACASPVNLPKYGAIPPLNWLNRYGSQPRNTQRFESVGYGLERVQGKKEFGGDTRLQSHPKLDSLLGNPRNTYIVISNNAATGGTCFGDSGGPTFDNTDSNVVVAVTSSEVSPNCGGIGGVYRLDQPDDLVVPRGLRHPPVAAWLSRSRRPPAPPGPLRVLDKRPWRRCVRWRHSTARGSPMPDRRALLHQTADLAADFLDALATRPVGATATRDELLEAFGGPMPARGEAPGEIVDHLGRAADPGIVASAGPRYFGFVIGGSLPSAVAADWLTTRLGPERLRRT